MLQHAVPSWSLAVVLGFTLASGAALSLATPVPRVAYLYSPFKSGWKSPPPLVTQSLRQILRLNPGWKVVPLTQDSADALLTAEGLQGAAGPPGWHTDAKRLATLRLLLLKATGGVWLDVGVLQTAKFQRWLPKATSEGFFAFRTDDDSIDASFLASAKGSPIVAAWLELALKALQPTPVPSDSVLDDEALKARAIDGSKWLASLFPNLMRDSAVKDAWSAMPSHTAHGPRCSPDHNAPMNFCYDKGCEAVPECIKMSEPIAGAVAGRKRLAFTHIPKTGGTSIEDAGDRKGFKWGRFDNYYDGADKSGVNRICPSPWHDPYHFGRHPSDEITFCVVRNPIERLISEFNFGAWDEAAVAERKARIIAQHAENSWGKGPGPKANCNPTDLNLWMQRTLSALQENRYGSNCHMTPTAAYLPACDYKIPYQKGQGAVKRFLADKCGIQGLSYDQVYPIHDKRCHLGADVITAATMATIKQFYADDVRAYEAAVAGFEPMMSSPGMLAVHAP